MKHCASLLLLFAYLTATPSGRLDLRTGYIVPIVSLNGESAYISFYDPVNDYSCRFYGTTATYYTGKSECIDVAVYAHNKIPYADNGTEYDPEQPELGGPRSRLIGYRDLRAGCRVDKSITDRKQTVTMFSQSGYMVASLMVDGYPQSNLNMIINK